MVSTVLANVLESYLGQYLELSDTKISVGSEIKLKNVSIVAVNFHQNYTNVSNYLQVKLRESALAEVGLPVKCVHGKVSRLVIKVIILRYRMNQAIC